MPRKSEEGGRGDMTGDVRLYRSGEGMTRGGSHTV
jgi:hypothetical protein